MKKRLLLIAGDNLFPDHYQLVPQAEDCFFMTEDGELCRRFPYHKHKLVLFPLAMRSHGKELAKNYRVIYWQIGEVPLEVSYGQKLRHSLAENPEIEELVCYRQHDRFALAEAFIEKVME